MKLWFRHSMDVAELMNIDQERINRSADLKVKLLDIISVVKPESWLDKIFKLFRRSNQLIFSKIFKYQVISNSGNTYTVLIKLSPGFNSKQFYKNKIQIFCTCPDFMYRAAYELNKVDNLVLNKATKAHLGIALTEAPKIVQTTPCCKHIYACLIDLKDNLKKYGLIQ